MSNIFLLEDDPDLTNIIRDSIEAQSHTLDNAMNGKDGLLALSQKRYDLIIMDWDLGESGPTGVEVCRAFRDAGGTTPVIMLTGRTGLQEKEAGLEAGADDYLTKPFQMRELNARIKAILRRSGSYSVGQAATTIGPATVIGDKYIIQEKIGQGGMATVWRAVHSITGKQVVVKVMLPHADAGVKRFEQECRIMARVEHPNVVTIYDAGSINGKQPYIVMEYLRGDSLSDILQAHGCARVKPALQIIMQCCSGLEAAHKAGIIHRDIKPANVIILDSKENRDWVKLVDFGIARLIDAKEKVTADGVAVGTLEYMAPEQLEGEQADVRSDIYALSVMLFEMLTGRMPFEAPNTRALIVKQLTETPAPPSHLKRELQGFGIDDLVAKGMNRDPDQRFQTAGEMAREAKKLLDLLTV